MHAGASGAWYRSSLNGAHAPRAKNHSKTRGRSTALPRQRKTASGNEVMNARRIPAAFVLRALAGIRAGESAASPSRASDFSPSGCMPTRPCAWTSKQAPQYVTYRISLTVAGAAQVDPVHGRRAPCFPFNCMRTSAHTSTKVRASVGPRPGAVKKTRGAARLSDGPPCAIVSARLVPAHAFACAVKRETGRASRAQPVLSPQR